jgi:hypothetical protein
VDLLSTEVIRGLLQAHEPPCISIYQPTHRHHPDNRQDPIRFRNLIRAVEESLRQKYRGRAVRPLLEPLQELAEDGAFWKHTVDGLAVLTGSTVFRLFRLQRPIKELAVVADSFHLKPLLRVMQSADRYQVLCLTRQTATMLEGNRYALDELDPGDLPATIAAALGDESAGAHLTFASYGGTSGETPMYHGHGSRKDTIDTQTERYFRAVDRAVGSQFSKPSGLPLILVALPEHQSVFRAVSQNASLIPNGVNGNPDAMSADQLREAVWDVVEPRYLARLESLSETFSSAAGRQGSTADLSDAARAAVQGRVATLLVEAERVIPGRLDPATGAIAPASLDDPEVGDMLDDLAEAVLRTGGEVVVVPKERMPSGTGVAATLRY